MRTEIQFLIDVILNHKLPSQVKDVLIARIGEVEASLQSRPIARPLLPVSAPLQAPSTQRILDEMALEGGSVITPPPQTRMVVPTEIITSKGNGTSTRGPRKF